MNSEKIEGFHSMSKSFVLSTVFEEKTEYFLQTNFDFLTGNI